jgi:2-polyprenyl-3-methyl-5-hydroxy-6-metoxy-1,4-benzoquinol methylase
LLIHQVLRETALKYPRPLIDAQLIDIPRVAFHIGLVKRAVGNRAAVCDIGGGIGMFSPACATLGMKVTLADDFLEGPSDTLRLHRDLGVTIISRDAALPPNCFDAITAFDALEPTVDPLNLLLDSLRPGGVFIMSIPNERPRSVATLRALAKALYLRRVRILGRNWTVRRRYLYRLADHILCLRPSLCINLYLIGHK